MVISDDEFDSETITFHQSFTPQDLAAQSNYLGTYLGKPQDPKSGFFTLTLVVALASKL